VHLGEKESSQQKKKKKEEKKKDKPEKRFSSVGCIPE
jgi:hypothetical protein